MPNTEYAAPKRITDRIFDAQRNQVELVAKQTPLLRGRVNAHVCDAEDALNTFRRHPDTNATTNIRIAIQALDDALAAALLLDPDEPAEQEACPLSGTMAAIIAQTEQRLDSPTYGIAKDTNRGR